MSYWTSQTAPSGVRQNRTRCAGRKKAGTQRGAKGIKVENRARERERERDRDPNPGHILLSSRLTHSPECVLVSSATPHKKVKAQMITGQRFLAGKAHFRAPGVVMVSGAALCGRLQSLDLWRRIRSVATL